MIAAFVLRGPATWRPMQLYDTLSLPPMNHFEYGGFHSSVFFHGLNHVSSRARSSQNFTGFRCASPEIAFLFITAFCTKALGGANLRFSFRSASMGTSAFAFA